MSVVIAFPRRASPVAAREPDVVPCGAAETGWRTCPWSETLGDYDRCNIYLFARLLQDEADGADIFDMARDVFGLSPWLNSQYARAVVESHLRRAHWIADNFLPMLSW